MHKPSRPSQALAVFLALQELRIRQALLTHQSRPIPEAPEPKASPCRYFASHRRTEQPTRHGSLRGFRQQHCRCHACSAAYQRYWNAERARQRIRRQARQVAQMTGRQQMVIRLREALTNHG